MVLHKNKWDHKAKISYLRKHGLTRLKEAPQMTPKWTSKKTAQKRTVIFDDSDDSDWDSEDEALLNHFYPEIGEQEIPVEQKLKIKRQIINGLREKQNELEKEPGAESEAGKDEKTASRVDEGEQEEAEEDEMGGIYLGTEPEIALPDLETKLSEFVMTDTFRPGKSRKLLKQKTDDTFWEDYGLGDYKDTVKETDYSAQPVNVDKLSASDLDGMRIGAEPARATGPRALTAQERQEHLERQEKDERARLYEQIRTKFGKKASRGKVLEINNINEDDAHQMDVLQGKIIKGKSETFNLDQDLHDLIGAESVVEDAGAPDLDELLRHARGATAGEVKQRKTVFAAPEDDDFLDQLLG